MRYGSHRILIGDVLDGLASLEAGSVRCCVTSPPYWGLRDYGTASWDGGDAACDHLAGPMASSKSGLRNDGREHVGPYAGEKLVTNGMPYRDTCGKCGARRIDRQIGLESTPEAYIERMVGVFRGVRRVLADDGTCWVNMGDCYATGAGSARSPGGDCFGKSNPAVEAGSFPVSQPNRMPIAGLKPKDLVGMPWRLAFALQADGWWLRSDIIWHKPNPMPESVTDRPTKSHEYIFLLTKNARYYYDAEAVKEPGSSPTVDAATYERMKSATSEAWYARNGASPKPGQKSDNNLLAGLCPPSGRNARSVWTIPTQAYSGAHFATFPEAIPERCIKAGTSERGKCPACGAAWRRVVERGETTGRTPGDGDGYATTLEPIDGVKGRKYMPNRTTPIYTTGWEPTCDHAPDPIPDVVLDPFAGSGTTLLVANKLGRNAVGCELNPAYAAMAERRIGAGLRPATFRDESNCEGDLFGGVQ